MKMEQVQPLHNKTDQELLTEFTSKKCTKSLGVLFERYLASAYQLAMKFMHNPADAEDAVQKALINIIRFSSTYSNKGSVRSWIMQTVVNTCKNEIKHLVRHRKHMQEQASQITNNFSETSLDAQEIKMILLKAIDQLPEHFRIPIWLVHYENMTVKEVSGSLGKPEKTIRTQLTRGLEKLQNILGNQNATLQGINISIVLGSCKKAEQIPPSLIEKVKDISQLKVSQRLLVSSAKAKTPINLPFKFFMVLMISTSIFLGFWFYRSFSKGNIQKAAENYNEIKTVKKTVASNNNKMLDLSCDFSSRSLPEWCSLAKNERSFEMATDVYGPCLKVNNPIHFLLNLSIPNEKIFFKASYNLKMESVPTKNFSFYSLFAKNENYVVFSFYKNLNLATNIWHFVEYEIIDKVCVIRINKKYCIISVKFNEDPGYKIFLSGMIAKIDNLKIQETAKEKIEDYSSIINLSKEYFVKKFEKSVTISSPIPNICAEDAAVFWENEAFNGNK